jgi:hypothetical protein
MDMSDFHDHALVFFADEISKNLRFSTEQSARLVGKPSAGFGSLAYPHSSFERSRQLWWQHLLSASKMSICGSALPRIVHRAHSDWATGRRRDLIIWL